jgi:hypothetical protein
MSAVNVCNVSNKDKDFKINQFGLGLDLEQEIKSDHNQEQTQTQTQEQEQELELEPFYIVDILGIAHDALDEHFWTMLEKVYYMEKLKIMLKEKYNEISEEKKYNMSKIEYEMYTILRDKLLTNNAWGVFIHYICYHGKNNMMTGAEFFDHVNEIGFEFILRTKHYFNCIPTYIDTYIIQEFICRNSPDVHINGFEQYDTGKITVLCRPYSKEESVNDIAKKIKRIFTKLQIYTENMSLHFVSVTSSLYDLSFPFILTDRRSNETNTYVTKHCCFHKFTEIQSWKKKLIEHHPCLKQLCHFLYGP